jgi:DNA modification methylase
MADSSNDEIEHWTNQIHQGDAVETLAEIPTDSVDCVMTSPPYYQLRDYSAEGQIGVEKTIEEFVAAITTVVDEARRVLKPTGSLWINIGDTFEEKSRQEIPARVAIALIDSGGYERGRVCWNKVNGAPQPADDRLTNRSEALFHFTPTTDYWFDPDERTTTDVWEVPIENNPTDHHAVFPVELPKRTIRLTTPPRVCAACGRPHVRDMVERPIDEPDPSRPQSVRAVELYQRSSLTEEHLRACRAVGFSDAGQGAATQTGAGRNTDRVERLAAEAKEVLGGYSREFAITRREPVGWTPDCDCDTGDTESGIVLDPFAGSGTTCLAAKELGRRFIGIDLNPEYVAMAQGRVGVDVDQPELLDGEHTPLSAFTDGGGSSTFD